MTVNNDRYELISQTYIEELRAEGILLKHKKSGARIALMCNDDENKVFSIGFRTRHRTAQVYHIYLNIRYYAVPINILLRTRLLSLPRGRLIHF